MSDGTTQETKAAMNKLTLKPAVSREELLRHTENDPEGADELLQLLRNFREDRRSRPEPE